MRTTGSVRAAATAPTPRCHDPAHDHARGTKEGRLPDAPNLDGLGRVLRTRRELLVAGMAGAFGLALEACGGATTKAASSIPPAGSDLGAVEHVVFLMHENRSFDHYYGTYPGVRGFGDTTAAAGVFNQKWDGATRGSSATTLLPFHLDTATSEAEC